MTTAQPSRSGRRVRSEAEKAQAEAAALVELRAHATVSIATLADALRVGKERAHVAVGKGDVPSIKVSGERRIPSAPILTMLGLAPIPSSEAAPPVEGGP